MNTTTSSDAVCHVCKHQGSALFSAKVLNKYDVTYFRCQQCGFIQTETPHWLGEAYDSAISSLDVGLVRRNLDLAELTEKVIQQCFNQEGQFLDYAGGYGLFVRLMRDKGYDFVREDRFCKNIFAVNHDLTDLTSTPKFELATAFEVFEHLTDPCVEIRKILEFSDSVLFTTEIPPAIEIKKPEDWWYFVPETGQHISFYSLKSLESMARELHCYFFTDRNTTHLFTRKKLKTDPLNFKEQTVPALIRRTFKLFRKTGDASQMKSLIPADFELARSKAREHAEAQMTDQEKI